MKFRLRLLFSSYSFLPLLSAATPLRAAVYFSKLRSLTRWLWFLCDPSVNFLGWWLGRWRDSLAWWLWGFPEEDEELGEIWLFREPEEDDVSEELPAYRRRDSEDLEPNLPDNPTDTDPLEPTNPTSPVLVIEDLPVSMPETLKSVFQIR